MINSASVSKDGRCTGPRGTSSRRAKVSAAMAPPSGPPAVTAKPLRRDEVGDIFEVLALNLDLGSELDDLPARYPKERGGAFGVTLQKREQRLSPHPHARDIFAGNDGLAADVIGDVGEIDAGQLALIAGQPETVVDRGILHEAVMQDYPRDAFDHLNHLRAIDRKSTR